MDFLPPDLTAYADAHTSPESELLRRLNRQTHAKVLHPRMLSGHFQGRMLSLFAHMMRPRRILEIGTYTGYSALCLAEGLTDDGRLVTIEKNEELEDTIRDFWRESPSADKIDLLIGNAADLIPTLTDTFDLVFIDADKISYSLYFDLVIDKVRPGGIIMADNVLWSGKVVQPVKPSDKDTLAVMAFNQKVQDDPRVENVLMPVRDGVMMMMKK
ncbi:methyltransferase [Rudanella paleaurantiibacter]|uniref:Methyltransferase n=1 Tax=Rudanella paleaurantiibacter TaxID=2614655 RepID=A0A7J5TS08_9BACT|nr:O-methyltransferase [Rudanella paleaurantiibacter]KAB7725598.1 methyltransferase [Rudanella paleaurantiibacter]